MQVQVQRAEELARYLRREEEALSCLGLLGTLEPAGPPIYRDWRAAGEATRRGRAAEEEEEERLTRGRGGLLAVWAR